MPPKPASRPKPSPRGTKPTSRTTAAPDAAAPNLETSRQLRSGARQDERQLRSGSSVAKAAVLNKRVQGEPTSPSSSLQPSEAQNEPEEEVGGEPEGEVGGEPEEELGGEPEEVGIGRSEGSGGEEDDGEGETPQLTVSLLFLNFLWLRLTMACSIKPPAKFCTPRHRRMEKKSLQVTYFLVTCSSRR
jgi:hypothetical protein